MVMGNASGWKQEGGAGAGAGSSSGAKNEVGEEVFMEEFIHGHGGGMQVSSYYAPPDYPFNLESMVQQSPQLNPRAYHSPFLSTPQPQVRTVPFGRPEITQIGNNDARVYEMGIPTAFTWIHGGIEVALRGSWDNWMQEEPLVRSGKEFSIVKLLKSGVYHYMFIVDGKWMCAPELPIERDGLGREFNILDLQAYVPDVLSTIPEPEYPSSPISSYDNAPFTLEDHDMKHLPELPPLLKQNPLDKPLTSSDGPEAVQKPLPATLNHLYVQRESGQSRQSGRSTVALSSTQRFRSKYVTVVLYKSLNAATN